ncbi:MAG: winged helix-turn-helix transcriptional regulator [Clostridia bacterium]|nr:winged helix-turn-helix transcriptional regulator [Clostridia bacterium]
MSKNEFICDCNIIHEEKVKDTMEKMPETVILNTLADFFKIMGDSTRCKLISALLQNEMCVCDLANVLSMTKSSISHQLSKMKDAGIVKCRKEGKTVYYSLDDSHISEIFEVGLKHINHKG